MRALLLAGVAALGWAEAAAAAPITATYDFTATFSTGPNPIVTGFVSLTYDPSVAGSDTISSFASQVLGGDTPIRATSGSSNITVGTDPEANGFYFYVGENTFGFSFDVDSTGDVTSSGYLVYAETANPSSYFGSTSLIVTRHVTAVPEPASVALLGIGLLGLTAADRRKRAG